MRASKRVCVWVLGWIGSIQRTSISLIFAKIQRKTPFFKIKKWKKKHVERSLTDQGHFNLLETEAAKWKTANGNNRIKKTKQWKSCKISVFLCTCISWWCPCRSATNTAVSKRNTASSLVARFRALAYFSAALDDKMPVTQTGRLSHLLLKSSHWTSVLTLTPLN